MELAIESPCQHVTWKVRDFFQLPSDTCYCVDSPEIRFAGDSYCLRLYPNRSWRNTDGAWTELELVRLTSTFPERNVSCKIGYRRRYGKGSEDEKYIKSIANRVLLKRLDVENERDMFVPNDTLTALCFMCLKVPCIPGIRQSEEDETSDTQEGQKGLPGQSVFLSSRLGSFKMELSMESPCQNVTWNVPDFFQLLSKIGNSLNSPEFRFAGDRYCLRFCPNRNKNGDIVDTDLELVKLTSTFAEIVVYRVGYIGRSESGEEYDIYDYSGELIGDFGFCVSLSQLERERCMYIRDDTFTVLCSMYLKEQSSEGSPQSEETGNSHTEEKQEGIARKEFVSCAVQTEVPDSLSCAIQTEVANNVIDKKNYKDEEWSSHDTKGVAVLSERMKELLIKGGDYDVTICVQNKEFRAHRNILSARSPVFAMMLAHDTKENNTGTISIEDCDPESFDEFLLYLYSGRTENLTPSNALGLYYPADKYDFPLLKERCVSLLKTSLSVESICDVVHLAAKHQEKELLKVATEFFVRNMKKIVVTVGWQKYLSHNPVEANELIIKSMEILHPDD